MTDSNVIANKTTNGSAGATADHAASGSATAGVEHAASGSATATADLKTSSATTTADFGAGKAMAVSSMCQRFAPHPSECDICIAGCPVGAITAKEHSLVVANDCIRCGACLGMCPMCALSCTRQTIQDINRKLLDATLDREHLIVTCSQTQLAKVPDALKEQIFIVPCLCMLGAEVWFSLLNEIEITALEYASILLPFAQCAACAANAKNNVEELFEQAIGTAELWSGKTVGIFVDTSELPTQPDLSLKGVLDSVHRPADRRDALTGIFKSLKNTWDEVGNNENRALIEVQAKRDRKLAYKRTRLGASLTAASGSGGANGAGGANGIKNGTLAGLAGAINKAGATGAAGAAALKTVPRGIVVPSRYILVDALGRNPKRADAVTLTVSATDLTLCSLCGSCIDVCAVHARRLSEITIDDDVDDSQPLPQYYIDCDSLYCVGCGRCLSVCSTNAISMTTISGSEFLL
ncbi:MAG: 4Fe-4S dicluster domain-containing protein [Coriobacteriales bacterium]|jgi:ferredoxin|nr:4Fe-4S dicluster domain-containing protein [Coriobacteriales bacterium]